MLPLKDISLRVLKPINQSFVNTPNHDNNNIKHSFLTHKLRASSHGRSNEENYPESRFSHQENGYFGRTTSKVKRRISTAGTNKRFPKDFFRSQDTTQPEKNDLGIVLKWRRNLIDVEKTKIGRKEYKIDVDLSIIEQNGTNVDTPKFKQPETSNEGENEFLIHRPMKAVTPFPLICELNLENEEKKRSVRPNFIKKVKKGEMLKNRLQSTRSISQNNQTHRYELEHSKC